VRRQTVEAELALGVDVKPSSGITSWPEWPDDVRPILEEWNRGTKDRVMKLSFYHHGIFDCADCNQRCEGHTTVAYLNNRWLCDDCLITAARGMYV